MTPPERRRPAEVALRAGELRLALLRERGRRLGEVLGVRADLLVGDLLLQRDGQRRPPADLPYEYVWFTTRAADGEDPCAAVGDDLGGLPGSG